MADKRAESSDSKPLHSITDDEIVTEPRLARRSFLTSSGILLTGAAGIVSGLRAANLHGTQDSKKPDDPDKKPEDPDKRPADPDKKPEDREKKPEDREKRPQDREKRPADPDKPPPPPPPDRKPADPDKPPPARG